MTRTLVRRLAAAGGALGIALALAAGPAAASVAAPASTPTHSTVVVNGDDENGDHGDHPCPHRGLLGDVIVDVVHIVADLLGGLL